MGSLTASMSRIQKLILVDTFSKEFIITRPIWYQKKQANSIKSTKGSQRRAYKSPKKHISRTQVLGLNMFFREYVFEDIWLGHMFVWVDYFNAK